LSRGAHFNIAKTNCARGGRNRAIRARRDRARIHHKSATTVQSKGRGCQRQRQPPCALIAALLPFFDLCAVAKEPLAHTLPLKLWYPSISGIEPTETYFRSLGAISASRHSSKNNVMNVTRTAAKMLLKYKASKVLNQGKTIETKKIHPYSLDRAHFSDKSCRLVPVLSNTVKLLPRLYYTTLYRRGSDWSPSVTYVPLSSESDRSSLGLKKWPAPSGSRFCSVLELWWQGSTPKPQASRQRGAHTSGLPGKMDTNCGRRSCAWNV